MSDVVIRPGTAAEILDLRHEILRTGLPRELAHFEGDEEPTTHHLVAELNGAIVGCATILHRPWNGQPAWQLRGMAVASNVQGRGIGSELLYALERIVRESDHSKQMWCNARVPATSFYEQRGWRIASSEFAIEHAGPHVEMTKRLEPQMNTDEHR